jgi:predicted MPP superfamily phosphohydrolase
VIDIVLKIIFIIILAVLVFTVLESLREFKNFKVKRYTVYDGKIPKAFEGYKLAVIGDLHNFRYSEDNSGIISCLEKENPDVLILVGDMVLCRKKAEAENLKTAEFVNRLAERFPLLYGIGNHEKGLIERKDDVGDIWQRYEGLLSDKVKILSNERVQITRNSESISVYGLDIDRYFYTRLKNIPMGVEYLDGRLGSCPDEFCILVAHNPDYFEDYAGWGAALTLSGHIHGGMVRLPFLGGVISPKLKLFPKYDYGYFENEGKSMIITGGLGGHQPQIRINNKPEIVIVNLEKTKK